MQTFECLPENVNKKESGNYSARKTHEKTP